MPAPATLALAPLGDRALTISLGSTIDEPTHRRVRAAVVRLEASAIPGVIDVVGAFASVTVHYDPVRVPPLDASEGDEPSPRARIADRIARALADLDDVALPAPRVIDIPVCYGGELGPDLDDVARAHGMTGDEVIRLHAAGDYLVHMIGFAPGFPYLGGLDPRLATPRRGAPRTRVPAGSVGIGGSQTGIYSIESPGGWHIIGRTTLRLFDPAREPATLLRAGDRLRFRPVSRDELRTIEERP
jgi:inhibitor of KinA